MEEDKDDTSSIPYIPFQLDYMRDVFHPKQFVKEKKEVSSSVGSSVTKLDNHEFPVYTSIYKGIMDISKKELRNQQSLQDLSESERIQADKLYKRILEIEKKHEEDSKNTIISDDSSTQFIVNQCGCPECCPRFHEDGTMRCDLCDLSLENESWQHHSQSICHQLKRQNKTHVYVNPFMNPSSNAFKWMTSMGWKEGEGLGVEGQGRLEPIPTRMKNNHLGVGATDLTYCIYSSYTIVLCALHTHHIMTMQIPMKILR